jgi:hypothetical protein
MKPKIATGLSNYPQCDVEVKKISDELWEKNNMTSKQKPANGKVIFNKSPREVLQFLNISPDFEVIENEFLSEFDYIHRRDGETEIYFVANRTNQWRKISCAFRVSGKAPELWDPVTGEKQFPLAHKTLEGRTLIPIEFPPYGASFVLFRVSSSKKPSQNAENSYEFKEVITIDPPFLVRFDTNLGAPYQVAFNELSSWTKRAEPE